MENNGKNQKKIKISNLDDLLELFIYNKAIHGRPTHARIHVYNNEYKRRGLLYTIGISR